MRKIFVPVLFVLLFLPLSASASDNNAEFVSQNVPATMVAGQIYQVSITMKNIGVTTWTNAGNYKLSTMNPMKNNLWGPCVVMIDEGDNVAPGQTKTFTFDVTAPSVPGTYNFQWMMLKEPSVTDSYSEFFGGLSQSVIFTFTVPSPTLTFAAAPSSITPGQSTTLSWSLSSPGACVISDACSCLASGNWSGNKALSGTQTVSPAKNSIYTLECSCPSCPGISVKKSANVYVSTIQVSQKIKIRNAPGEPEFYNSVTGQKFIPRGNNYIRLYDYDGSGSCYSHWHSTLDHFDYVKKTEGIYNATRAELALARMQSDGYNVVRVFLNNKAMSGQKGGPEVDPEYIKNVVDFLKRARSHGIYVILTTGGIGTNYMYDVGSIPLEFDHGNALYLWQERIDALKRQWKDIITEIKAQDAAVLPTVFGYEVVNEARFNRLRKPFSLQSGLVTVAEGGTYDMADASQKTLMEDRSSTYFANQLTEAVKEVDPEALVTVSIGEFRLLPLESSNIDYIDIHIYPSGSTDEEIHEFFISRKEVDKSGHTKPIIAQEFGVSDQQGTYFAYYPDVNSAAAGAVNLQNISCEYGFQGWLLWTWDCEEQGGWWYALRENGEVGRVLSPLYRSDPCSKEPTSSTLVISGVSSSSVSENSAKITWTTDKHATSQVEYGETISYGSLTALDGSLVTGHSVTLSDLSSGTTYHYRVRSRDGNGGERISGDYVFSTGGFAAYLKMNLDNNPAIGETATKAVDQSPYGNNGTFYNHAAWTAEGRYGGGVRFDGVDDYVQTAANNALDSSSAGTVTAWIKTSAGSAQAIVSYTTSSVASSNYVWRVRNNVLEMAWNYAGAGGNWNLINGATPVNDGKWHFVAFVSDGLNRNKIYLDGVEQATTFTSTGGSTNDKGWTSDMDGVASYDHHINLGGLNRGMSPTNWFSGTIDHVRVWKKALTSEEIRGQLADLNGDDNVDISDLILIAANLGKTSNFDTSFDTDNSGEIDIYDVVFVASRFT